MHYFDQFEEAIREIPIAWIPMRDGCRLAARIWLPQSAWERPVPAILEYLPYRRRDGTAYRDAITQPYMAGHGYAAVRVDIRGTGDSEGVITDEYSQAEIQDGGDVIAWIASQPWCTGKVGMWGISWGGINALQVAALAPPALKAIIPIGFAHDRYNGDCHFMGGCFLEGNISWGNTLLANSSRPPDPAILGAAWRDMWLKRLEAIEQPIATWLHHQRRDDYWKPGSVSEDYARIRAAVYAVSGWQDSYSRNVFPLLAGLKGPRKGLIGPWAHSWPHLATPGPAIGFLQEALRWWDYWLKDIDTGIMDEPMLRVFMGEWSPPSRALAIAPGRWIFAENWPEPDKTLNLSCGGRLGAQESLVPTKVAGTEILGLSAGYQCSYGIGPDLSDDQRLDDAGSTCFDTPPLDEPLELFGEPFVDLTIQCDEPQAILAARLCEIGPDGASLRLTYGLLNLAYRDSYAEPKPMVPGKPEQIRIPLCGLAHRIAAGHRLRLALSTHYWPIAWPSPRNATVILLRGRLNLPRFETQQRPAAPSFAEPEGARPHTIVETRSRNKTEPLDRIERNAATREATLIRKRDRGAWRTTDTDVDYDMQGELRFSIREGEPLSACQEFQLTTSLGRSDWRTRCEARSRITADIQNFRIVSSLKAHDGDVCIFSREWDILIPRDHM